MVAHWDALRDGKCLNYQQQEIINHLNLCGNPKRTRLLNEMADKLGEWLSDNYAHPELAYWIPRYNNAGSQYYNSDLVCGLLQGFSTFIYIGAVSSTIKVVGK